MVSRWAGEAESGFEGLQVEPFGGRAWEEVETEPLEPCTIRVSASVWRLIERDVSRQGMTVSAWTCQASPVRSPRPSKPAEVQEPGARGVVVGPWFPSRLTWARCSKTADQM